MLPSVDKEKSILLYVIFLKVNNGVAARLDENNQYKTGVILSVKLDRKVRCKVKVPKLLVGKLFKMRHTTASA